MEGRLSAPLVRADALVCARRPQRHVAVTIMPLLGAARSDKREYDVLAVGELNVDLILSGVSRVPEFGEEVLAEDIVQRLGGSSANFAVFCARLGLKVAFVTRVGADDFGDFLLRELEQRGVSQARS